MTFWGGSGSGSSDPCFWLVDPDPAIFVIDLQDASKKLIFNTIFSAYYFLKVRLHHFSKIKSLKESQNRRNQGFSYYFCMMIEGSGSGYIPLTSGSGSGRPKNMWIRWIRRIRNTDVQYTSYYRYPEKKFDLSKKSKSCLKFAKLFSSHIDYTWQKTKKLWA
jgi:hypothetical protein